MAACFRKMYRGKICNLEIGRNDIPKFRGRNSEEKSIETTYLNRLPWAESHDLIDLYFLKVNPLQSNAFLQSTQGAPIWVPGCFYGRQNPFFFRKSWCQIITKHGPLRFLKNAPQCTSSRRKPSRLATTGHESRVPKWYVPLHIDEQNSGETREI